MAHDSTNKVVKGIRRIFQAIFLSSFVDKTTKPILRLLNIKLGQWWNWNTCTQCPLFCPRFPQPHTIGSVFFGMDAFRALSISASLFGCAKRLLDCSTMPLPRLQERRRCHQNHAHPVGHHRHGQSPCSSPWQPLVSQVHSLMSISPTRAK